MSYWFRPVLPCADHFDAWVLVWGWIGDAHSKRWYSHTHKV